MKRKKKYKSQVQEYLPSADLNNKQKSESIEESASSLNQPDELAFFKTQYNQIYACLEHKNVESLGYYNEIQRLNTVLCSLTYENETLNEQYDNLAKECQMQQTTLDDLNQQTSELNAILAQTKNSVMVTAQLQLQENDKVGEDHGVIKTETGVLDRDGGRDDG